MIFSCSRHISSTDMASRFIFLLIRTPPKDLDLSKGRSLVTSLFKISTIQSVSAIRFLPIFNR